MKSLCKVLCCVLGALSLCSASGADTKWPDGKKAAFYLSFDDGCPSQITNVFPLLREYRIPGTFYVCPGWDLFKVREAAWSNANEYVFLGNHTFTHGKIPDKAALDSELSKCNEVIARLRPQQKGRISFAVPGAESLHKVLEITDEEIAETYARHNLVERYLWHGYPVQCKTIPEMEAYVDSVVASGGFGHMDFHGVGGDWLDPGFDYFKALLKKLDAHRDDIWFTTHIELVEWMSRNPPAGK